MGVHLYYTMALKYILAQTHRPAKHLGFQCWKWDLSAGASFPGASSSHLYHYPWTHDKQRLDPRVLSKSSISCAFLWPNNGEQSHDSKPTPWWLSRAFPHCGLIKGHFVTPPCGAHNPRHTHGADSYCGGIDGWHTAIFSYHWHNEKILTYTRHNDNHCGLVIM